jgi:GR25 family glycosyltransferase involved in LPS biosynthesis
MQAMEGELPEELRPMVRVEAVVGKSIDPRDPKQPLSPLCRKQLLQPWRVCNDLQIDSLGAVGVTLSHVLCWHWLLDSEHQYALILEDDCQFVNGFAAIWYSEVRPILLGRTVDVLVLGHALRQGIIKARQSCHKGGHLAQFGFEGTHCYAVTREGARRLLSLVFPIQWHIDGFISAVVILSEVRGLAWRTSLATQSPSYGFSYVAHYGAQSSLRRLVPDVTPGYTVLLLALITLVAVMLSAHFTQVKRG